MDNYHLERFIKAQEEDYETALKEIRSGKKRSHWIWYIFPQLVGLGSSFNAEYYGIKNQEEAEAYLKNEVLYHHLVEICEALLELESNDIVDIMRYPDNLKLQSSMTLFDFITLHDSIFRSVLEKFYQGEKDKQTIKMLTL